MSFVTKDEMQSVEELLAKYNSPKAIARVAGIAPKAITLLSPAKVRKALGAFQKSSEPLTPDAVRRLTANMRPKPVRRSKEVLRNVERTVTDMIDAGESWNVIAEKAGKRDTVRKIIRRVEKRRAVQANRSTSIIILGVGKFTVNKPLRKKTVEILRFLIPLLKRGVSYSAALKAAGGSACVLLCAEQAAGVKSWRACERSNVTDEQVLRAYLDHDRRSRAAAKALKCGGKRVINVARRAGVIRKNGNIVSEKPLQPHEIELAFQRLSCASTQTT